MVYGFTKDKPEEQHLLRSLFRGPKSNKQRKMIQTTSRPIKYLPIHRTRHLSARGKNLRTAFGEAADFFPAKWTMESNFILAWVGRGLLLSITLIAGLFFHHINRKATSIEKTNASSQPGKTRTHGVNAIEKNSTILPVGQPRAFSSGVAVGGVAASVRAFNSSVDPDPAEQRAMHEVRESLGSRLLGSAAATTSEMNHDFKMLRLVRGQACDVRAAATAFREALEYRESENLSAARSELLAAGAAQGLSDGQPAWVYSLPRFQPLVDCVGPGLMHYLGTDYDGLETTLCLIHEYDLRRVIRNRLSDLLVLGQRYLDEYWDIELHRLSKVR